jgi:hypothetical protein
MKLVRGEEPRRDIERCRGVEREGGFLRRKAGRVSGRRDIEEEVWKIVSRRYLVEERAREMSGGEERVVEGGICGGEAMERYFKACAVDSKCKQELNSIYYEALLSVPP